MAAVAQLVRALDCGSGGRGFETRQSPHVMKSRGSLLDLFTSDLFRDNPRAYRVLSCELFGSSKNGKAFFRDR